MNKKIDYKLTQSYELVNAKFNLSALPLNIFYIIAMQINQKDTELKEYHISKTQLESITNKKINYLDLKKAIKTLVETSIDLSNRSTNEIEYLPLFYKLKFKDNVVSAKIHPELQDHFLNLSNNFISVSFLKNMSKINSSYAKRMYLLLKQRVKLKKWVFQLDYLHDIFKTPKSFKIYNNFKTNVLLKSVNEINDNTDLNISFLEIKEGRSVVALEFSINYVSNTKEKVDSVEDWLKETENIIDCEVI